tara:strand:- start:420 stop:698 length:279 start_codon:yes stop_codon:yes gene_type:complete
VEVQVEGGEAHKGIKNRLVGAPTTQNIIWGRFETFHFFSKFSQKMIKIGPGGRCPPPLGLGSESRRGPQEGRNTPLHLKKHAFLALSPQTIT